MRLAPIAARVPTLEDNPPLLQNVEARRHLGKGARCIAQASWGTHEARPSAQRWRGRYPLGQEHRCWAEERGYDGGGKKVKGTKRHLLVETEGLVLKAKVHSAKVMDFERGSRLS